MLKSPDVWSILPVSRCQHISLVPRLVNRQMQSLACALLAREDFLHVPGTSDVTASPLGAWNAAPSNVSSSSVSAPTCLRAFLFFAFDGFVPLCGERLRSLCSDWSLSLRSEFLSSPSLNSETPAAGMLTALEVVFDGAAAMAVVRVLLWRSGRNQTSKIEGESGKTSEQRCSAHVIRRAVYH